MSRLLRYCYVLSSRILKKVHDHIYCIFLVFDTIPGRRYSCASFLAKEGAAEKQPKSPVIVFKASVSL